ncbi:MAG: sodium/proton-translocating pyrophosphatase, partial [Akkermansia sp.]|nr:sodium/proton-translocating pyrophosphatase [Akkermansia sp.]
MITIQDLFWLIPSASVLALIFAGIFFYRMKAQDEGNEVMKMIARHVRSGAMAYLRQQYKIVAIFFVLITVVFAFLAYCLHIQNPWVPFAFISGGFFSGLAGYIGMKTATYASGRVANACRHSLDAGLQIAFRSGAVLGLTVVGLAMLDIGAWYWVLDWFYGDMELSMRLVVITTTMLTFGMGASLQALFAR